METFFNSACEAHYVLLGGPLFFFFFPIKIDSPFSRHEVQRSPFGFHVVHVVVDFLIQQNSEICQTGHQIGYGLKTYILLKLFFFFSGFHPYHNFNRLTLNFKAFFFIEKIPLTFIEKICHN